MFTSNCSLIRQYVRIGLNRTSHRIDNNKLTQLRGAINLPFKHVHLNAINMTDSAGSKLKAKDSIVWVDMEMTGLDISTDQIMEIACLITDQHLNIIAEGPELVVHQPDHILSAMGEWCTENHKKTGLTEACRKSKLTIQEVDEQVLNFLKLHTPAGVCPIAGNSIYMDRLFINRHMPLLDKHLHYRIIDVSTLKELCRRWYPEEFANAPKKAYGHRAMIDVRESIAELQYYTHAIFKNQENKEHQKYLKLSLLKCVPWSAQREKNKILFYCI